MKNKRIVQRALSAVFEAAGYRYLSFVSLRYPGQNRGQSLKTEKNRAGFSYTQQVYPVKGNNYIKIRKL
jgi:hypothetical protein